MALTAAVALATFLARVRLPHDERNSVLDFLQVGPARVPQCVACFALGALARPSDSTLAPGGVSRTVTVGRRGSGLLLDSRADSFGQVARVVWGLVWQQAVW
ncbi:hypothetical protein ABZ922_19735 [Streptomyces shenzhenensis]|uniref:hypothetical protein n=1 Tax=Streptomyces shenzhenensis TaxID=943815 RepID=UPI0033C1215E